MFLSVFLLPDYVEFCLSLFILVSISFCFIQSCCTVVLRRWQSHRTSSDTILSSVSFDSDMPCAIVVFQIRVSPFHCGTLTVSALFRRSKRNVFSSAFVAVYDRNMPQLTGEIPDFTCIISGIRQIIKNRCTLRHFLHQVSALVC